MKQPNTGIRTTSFDVRYAKPFGQTAAEIAAAARRASNKRPRGPTARELLLDHQGLSRRWAR